MTLCEEACFAGGRQWGDASLRLIFAEDSVPWLRLCDGMYICQVDAVWVEAARFRVRDEKGTIHIVVEMRDESSGAQPRRAHAGFYFLLDGQDVRRASEDTFVNLSTGEILVRVAD